MKLLSFYTHGSTDNNTILLRSDGDGGEVGTDFLCDLDYKRGLDVVFVFVFFFLFVAAHCYTRVCCYVINSTDLRLVGCNCFLQNEYTHAAWPTRCYYTYIYEY